MQPWFTFSIKAIIKTHHKWHKETPHSFNIMEQWHSVFIDLFWHRFITSLDRMLLLWDSVHGHKRTRLWEAVWTRTSCILSVEDSGFLLDAGDVWIIWHDSRRADNPRFGRQKLELLVWNRITNEDLMGGHILSSPEHSCNCSNQTKHSA